MTVKQTVPQGGEARDLAILERAYGAFHKMNPSGPLVRLGARYSYAELRAAVYAVVPGKQNHRNIAGLLHQATLAVSRVIRRRK